MADRYKITFDGRLNPNIPSTGIRERLLKLYGGDQRSVNLFFTGKRLIVNKNLDHAAALKQQAVLEQAGVPCRVVREEPTQPPVAAATARTAAPATPPAQRQQAQAARPHDFSFRGIIAESWGLIYGVKGELIGSTLLAAMCSAVLFLIGYGIIQLMGEAGRNFYIAYGILHGFGLFGYPFLAGIIMMGVQRATGAEVRCSMTFRFLAPRMFLLSIMVSAINYMMFAALYSMGVDHFYAQASSILTLPVFALTVPLVAVSGMGPVAAFGRLFGMLNRHSGVMAALYPAIACINIFGNFVLIGFVWTIPLLFVANGVLFRNLLDAERESTAAAGLPGGVRRAGSPGMPRAVSRPILEGNTWQNVLAALFVGLIIAGAGARLWALNEAYRIALPDHVAANSRGVCVHADKKLYFLSPEGRTERNVSLSSFGLGREPADLELLEDGSLLIGDLDKKTILRCPDGNPPCRAAGPPINYQIADNFKFLADEKRGLVFIADTNNHRIIVQDLNGAHYRNIEGLTRIDYPNDMALDEEGLLWVSNTFHERLLCFKVEGDKATETGKAISLNPLASGVTAIGQALLGAKDRRQTLQDLLAAQKDIENLKKDLPSAAQDMLHARPMALAWGADGNVWVAASDPIGASGGVRVFGPDGKQVRSIHLDRGAIPEDVVRLGDRLLIADPGLFRIFAAQSYSGNIFPFGDETFQRALTEARGRLELYEAIGKWSKLLLWAVGIATAALLLIILRTRRTAAKTKAG